MRGAIEREEYNASASAEGLQAPNRAQNLRSWFRSEGVELVPRTAESGEWCVRWQTEAWGRNGRMRQAGAAAPVADGPRVEYRRAGLLEWYENGKEGVEQGFTLANRPAGAGPLRIEGRISGELRATASACGDAVDFLDRAGVLVLRYGKLAVHDARGARLDARLDLGQGRLAIEVEDQGATYPLTVDPVMTSPAWTAESDQAGSFFGFSVATAGDVNGDGYSDVIVGAVGYDNGENNEGRAFVYHGSATGLAVSPAWTGEGNQADASFGISVATAGDVNGDGYSDVIVGAELYDNGETDEGRAFVYYGSPTGLAASPGWTAEGNQADARFGFSVATAGDVNGDGFSDVIVGAHSYDNGETDEGRAFVYHGSATGLAVSPAWTAESNQANAQFGISVATAGDVNGDGFSDVIVGANQYTNGQPIEGRAFVYHGSASGLAASAAWTAEGDQVSGYFGTSVATAGDVNGDGYSDVIVGAFAYDNTQLDGGQAFVYHGSATGLSLFANWTAEGGQVGAGFGQSVATAGDVNGDGYADVIIGAYTYDNGEANEGRAVVYLGSASGLFFFPAAWTAESDQAGARFGRSVATAGDVNGDGYSDVIVGADSYDNGQTDEGRAYVYLGSASGPALLPAWAAESDQANALFGYSVATAGDVNGDGYSDVVVGARDYDNGLGAAGRAFVYHGSATGLAASPAWTADGGQASAEFGVSVATAGDVNGDGYSDVIVGADLFDNGEQNEGRAFVYHGSPSGLAGIPAWTGEPNRAGAQFGVSVATAGDVNGDGYSDVIVGAQFYSNVETLEGLASVYLGSATGLAGSPAWTAEGNQVNAFLGASVATAGDVNGDGYSDVVVGAHGYSNGEQAEGRVFVYHGSAAGLAGSPAWTAESNQALADFGVSVATAGDVNGDGYSDVLVGADEFDTPALNRGRVFVYHGSASGLTGSPARILDGDQAAFFGFSVATAGDVNGDGFSDVIVGAYGYTNGQASEGRAFVYHGSATGLLASPDWTAESNQATSFLGYSVASAGDVNGDGYADVIVGAYNYDNPQANEGRAFLYYGNGSDGLDAIARQRRADDSVPIGLLGRAESGSFRLAAMGRSPAGRGRVRMEYEVKPLGTPFNGAAARGTFLDTGAPAPSVGSATALDELVSGLPLNTPLHWRLRVRTNSPFFPRSRWLSMAYNSPTETDLRTGSTPPPPFSLAPSGLPAMTLASSAWGDYDNDGDLDLLIAGILSPSGTTITRIYRNDGGVFNDIGAQLRAVNSGGPPSSTWATWVDYDNDGDLDAAYCGFEGSARRTFLYRNDGGTFTEIPWGLPGVGTGSLAWGDYDLDGRLDVAIAGQDSTGTAIARIYRNLPGGFTDIGASLVGSLSGGLAWGDFDKDGDLDLAQIGTSGSRVYRNDPGGFTDITGNLLSTPAGMAQWVDRDQDGDLDLMLAGAAGLGLFDDVSGAFSNSGLTFPAASGPRSAVFGDYDNDGDPDVLFAGGGITSILRNDGTALVDIGAGLPGALGPSAVGPIWGDYDNDGRLDFLLSSTSLFKNSVLTANTPPSPPANLQVMRNANRVTFSWSAASDAQTTGAALTYNVRVGTSPGGNEIVPAQSAANGYRRVVQNGNAQGRTFLTLELPPGVYHWSVQAVDAAFAGSAFAAEQNIDALTGVPGGVTPARFALSAAAPNPLSRDATLTYELARKVDVRIEVFDVGGRHVRTLVSETRPAGRHTVRWDALDDTGRRVPAGLYLCRMRAGEFAANRRLLVIP
ncbi:MAG TPA: FG-GAP-like repeat-containing protein [Candidatus Eisenbacteria bacterium]